MISLIFSSWNLLEYAGCRTIAVSAPSPVPRYGYNLPIHRHQTCGDMIVIYLGVKGETERIIDAKFESYGCAANIAAASTLTEMVKGKSLREAWGISWRNVSDDLGGLPSVKYHCGMLAVGALKRGHKSLL